MYKKKCGKKCKNVIQNNICKKKTAIYMENSFSFFRKVQLYALCVILQDKIFFLTYTFAQYIFLSAIR